MACSQLLDDDPTPPYPLQMNLSARTLFAPCTAGPHFGENILQVLFWTTYETVVPF